MEQKFYICKHCGNIIAKVKDTGVPVIPGTTDAAVEKHVPVWTVENGIVHVKVGSVEHPMLPEHYIEWVSLHTKQGNQRKELHPGEKPEVCFALCEGDEVEAVYACIDKGISLDELSLEEYKEISPVFEQDIYEAISMKTCVEKRETYGAPGPKVMEQIIALNREYLKNN